MKNFKIAITGGIGSGKTYASNVLKNAGYKVLSCDQVANEIYKKRGFLRQLKKLFPSAVNGRIFLKADKRKISQEVFCDILKRQDLEALLQPLIINRIMKQANRLRGIVFVEVPLLFEGDYQKKFDEVIIILRDKNQRIISVKERSKLSEKEILMRMICQIDYERLDLTEYIAIQNKDENFEKEVLSVAKRLEDKFLDKIKNWNKA